LPVCGFVQHKGVRILEMHWEDLEIGPLLAAIEEARQTVSKEPKGSVLALTYVANSRFDSSVSGAIREMAAANKEIVRRSAAVGVTGAQQVVLTGIRILTGRDIRGFDDVEKAKDWLIQG
jgi:hypothetical protein